MRVKNRFGCFLAVTALACLSAAMNTAWAEGRGLSVTFVPKTAKTDEVPVEIVKLSRRADAREKELTLRKLVAERLRLERPGDQYTAYGKCIVQVRQWEVGDAHFQVECYSFAMWEGDDPYHSVGRPSSAAEVMTLIDAFLAKHQERLARKPPLRNGQVVMT